MSRWSEGLGRTVIIAGIAGSVFAGFLALTPRLTAADVSGATDTSAPPAVESSLPGIADPVIAVPDRPVDVSVTVTTAPTEGPAERGTTTTTLPIDPAFDGTIDLSVDARNATDADALGVLIEGDEIQWRFTLTNTSAEELWGAYVFLELHGAAWCDEHHLEPGGKTECWLATTAVEGIHTAEAWATAWTVDRIVKDQIHYTFEVTL